MKKLFILFVFLNFYVSIGFGADIYVPAQCYEKKHSFRDPLVQQYIDDYRVLMISYSRNFSENDPEKMQNLTVSAQELGKKAPVIAERLTDPEEIQKFNDEISGMSSCFTNEITDISNKQN